MSETHTSKREKIQLLYFYLTHADRRGLRTEGGRNEIYHQISLAKDQAGAGKCLSLGRWYFPQGRVRLQDLESPPFSLAELGTE